MGRVQCPDCKGYQCDRKASSGEYFCAECHAQFYSKAKMLAIKRATKIFETYKEVGK